MNDEIVKIPLTTLCARLERAIHCDVGMKGLETLLCGWSKQQHRNLNGTLFMREERDGFKWLSPQEVTGFSRYAGYDLSVD